MSIFEALRVAWTSLQSNKLRSLLTMLGIIIGVGSVIGLLAIGAGFQAFLNSQFSTLGVGVFYVAPGAVSRNVREANRATLTAEDARALAAPGVAPAVSNIVTEFNGSGSISNGRKRVAFDVRGVSASHFVVTTNTIGAGRLFYDAEDATNARVAVIGEHVAIDLFQNAATAVGERITINGVGFQIIGVLTNTNTGGGGPFSDVASTVFVPYNTAISRLYRNQVNSRVNVSLLTVQARSPEEVDDAIRQVTEALRQRHRLTYQNNDFTIINLDQILATFTGIIGAFNAFLAIVGGISLLVGGIGIMNIMLVSVAERTREIGLRKAVGARRRDILIQFLIEALVLALVGGLFGILLGYALSFLGTFALHNAFQAESASAEVKPSAVMLATGIAAAVGIVFGFYPALQASRLRPIEALRYE